MVLTKYVTSGNLAKIIDLPVEMQNSLLEISVRIVEKEKNPDTILKTIDNLCGIAKDSGKPFADYKKERLAKYETAH